MKTEQEHPNDNAKQDPLLSRRDSVKGFASVASAVAMGSALTSQAAEPQPSDPCEPKNPYDSPPGSGISMPPYYKPTPSVKNHNNYFPRAEELGADHVHGEQSFSAAAHPGRHEHHGRVRQRRLEMNPAALLGPQ